MWTEGHEEATQPLCLFIRALLERLILILHIVFQLPAYSKWISNKCITALSVVHVVVHS